MYLNTAKRNFINFKGYVYTTKSVRQEYVLGPQGHVVGHGSHDVQLNSDLPAAGKICKQAPAGEILSPSTQLCPRRCIYTDRIKGGAAGAVELGH